MNKLIELIRSLWWGPIVSVIAALAILVFRDPPHHESGDAFDYIGAFAFGLLIAGILWLMLYATDIERRQDLEEKARRASSAKFTAVTAPAELSVTRIEQDLALRVKEASAALYQSVEFLCERAATGKESSEKVLPQIAEAADELIVAAQLEKGRPNPGDRLADLPPNSCTIFNRIPAPTPEQKGQLVEVRNCWVGFRSDAQLVIVNPSRVSVYV